MKIEFPLYLVCDPTDVSEMVDVVWRIRDYAHLERVINGGTPLCARNVTLYTDVEEAERDATARLMARDARKTDEWIPLRDLRPGAMFVTEAGLRGIRRRKPAPEPGRVRVVWLEAGSDGNALDSLMVREVPL